MVYRVTLLTSLAALPAAAACLAAGLRLPGPNFLVPAGAALAAAGLVGLNSALALRRLAGQVSRLGQAVAELKDRLGPAPSADRNGLSRSCGDG